MKLTGMLCLKLKTCLILSCDRLLRFTITFDYAGANCEGIEAAVILGENQSCPLEIIAKAIYTLLQVRSTNVEIGAQLWHIGTGE